MDGPRTPSESETLTIIDFLNRHLRPDNGWSIDEEYPTTFAQKNLENLHVIKNEEGVLSHAATRYLLIKTPQVVLKVAAIGSVVTSSDHRRQGLSQSLLQRCLEKAQKDGADLAILWTNLYDFYRKLGFELAGREISFLIDKELNIENNDLIIRENANISAEALQRVYSQHTVTSVRSAEEIRKYLKIPNSRVYTAWDRRGFLQAYAVEGKGADLDSYIHEWGGGISKLMPLFSHIRKSQQRPITLICPAHSTSLIQTLEDHQIEKHDGYLGMIRLMNFESMKGKIIRHSRAMGLQGLSLEEKSNGIDLSLGEERIHFQTSGQFTRFIFGPDTENYLAKLKPSTRNALSPLFPLHLWIWGWDSI